MRRKGQSLGFGIVIELWSEDRRGFQVFVLEEVGTDLFARCYVNNKSKNAYRMSMGRRICAEFMASDVNGAELYEIRNLSGACTGFLSRVQQIKIGIQHKPQKQ
ncbi:hypothetical protein KFK09_012012 [Dendrobium nobile]|uniref:Uncharacterized protein n=1 Tax=Dendrobium nobile TaxID=94219 RepID=A0A8T3BE70_DENNO|nr:hypothetical protein KFK09_012012 [Dendrobium nobile]